MSYDIGGNPVSAGNIVFPRQGAWYASLDVAGDKAASIAINKKTTLSIFGISYVCTPVLNAPLVVGHRRINVVGGGGTMSTLMKARNLANGPSLITVINELMKDAASDAVSPTTVTGFLKAWQSITGLSVGKQLSKLLKQFGAVWRVSKDGTVLVTKDSYPALVLPKDQQQIGSEPSGAKVYAVQSFNVIPQPGTTLDGTKIEEVEIEFDGSKTTMSLRPFGLEDALSTALQGTSRTLSFSQSWPGAVTSQSDQTLNINPDDQDLKGSGLGVVPMTFGIPGVTVQVSAGTRVRFCYDVSDPGRPRVCAFESGVGGADLLVTVGDPAGAQFAAMSSVVNKNFQNLKTWTDAHVHPTGVGPSGPPASPSPTPSDVACTRFKVS